MFIGAGNFANSTPFKMSVQVLNSAGTCLMDMTYSNFQLTPHKGSHGPSAESYTIVRGDRITHRGQLMNHDMKV